MIFAELTPDASSIGWFLVILVAIVHGADKVMDFWKKHVKETPPPSMTYVTIENFEVKFSEMVEKVEKFIDDAKENRIYQAKARARIHKRMNAHEIILAFQAGLAEASGNHALAQFTQKKLDELKRADDAEDAE